MLCYLISSKIILLTAPALFFHCEGTCAHRMAQTFGDRTSLQVLPSLQCNPLLSRADRPGWSSLLSQLKGTHLVIFQVLPFPFSLFWKQGWRMLLCLVSWALPCYEQYCHFCQKITKIPVCHIKSFAALFPNWFSRDILCWQCPSRLWHLPEHQQWLGCALRAGGRGPGGDVCVTLGTVALLLSRAWLCGQCREHTQVDGVVFPWL